LVDPGEYTLALEMAVEPEPGERLIVRVRYKDGGTPAYATLALASPPRWWIAFSGVLDSRDIRAKPFWGKAAPG